MHCFLFWGGDIVRAYKSAKAGRYDDRHHAHMAKHCKQLQDKILTPLRTNNHYL